MELKLGSTRKWVVGYFNGGVGGFSEEMDLVLENEPAGTRPSVSKATIVDRRVELRPGFGDENFETEDDNSKIQIKTKRGRPNLKPEGFIADDPNSEYEEIIEYVDEYEVWVFTNGTNGTD